MTPLTYTHVRITNSSLIVDTHTLISRTLSHINKLPHIISCYYNTNSSKLKKMIASPTKFIVHMLTRLRIGIGTHTLHISHYVPQVNKNVTILSQYEECRDCGKITIALLEEGNSVYLTSRNTII